MTLSELREMEEARDKDRWERIRAGIAARKEKEAAGAAREEERLGALALLPWTSGPLAGLHEDALRGARGSRELAVMVYRLPEDARTLLEMVAEEPSLARALSGEEARSLWGVASYAAASFGPVYAWALPVLETFEMAAEAAASAP